MHFAFTSSAACAGLPFLLEEQGNYRRGPPPQRGRGVDDDLDTLPREGLQLPRHLRGRLQDTRAQDRSGQCLGG